MNKNFDVTVVGAGAAGIMASISAAQEGKRVLLLEKLPNIATKLKATGGGRCNLTNTLPSDEFMKKFGKNGRFMREALNAFDAKALRDFFLSIGVQSHAPDGFRVFPITHNSSTILEALQKELMRLNVTIITSVNIECIEKKEELFVLKTQNEVFETSHLIVATGGLGYPLLGATGDGYAFAKMFGHSVTSLHPAMMPLYTKQSWVGACKANTIAKVTLKVDLPKYKKLRAVGDLIFTSSGIRGPVVLDFAREITPILEEFNEVPILVNLTKGLNEEQLFSHLKTAFTQNPNSTIEENLNTLLPLALCLELLKLCDIEATNKWNKIEGIKKEKLIKMLAWTPLTICGHDGFKNAMITRGGVSLKEIDPKTMESKIIKGLFFCGEVMNLDGPCGGYNLQWSFSSGFLAGKVGCYD